MATSKINWCDSVWNPTVGCSRVSPGCMHCYAEKMAARLEHMGKPEYAGLTTRHADKSVNWTGEVRTLPDRLTTPFEWKKGKVIFVDSMSDLFHEKVPDAFIESVFGAMAVAQQHTFLILTKRPERALQVLSHPQISAAIAVEAGAMADRLDKDSDPERGSPLRIQWPLPNVWIGISAENQDELDKRAQILRKIPAARRFVSGEPLLGDLDFLPHFRHWSCAKCGHEWEADPSPRYRVPYGKDEMEFVGWEAPTCPLSYSAQNLHVGQSRCSIDWVILGGQSGGPSDESLVEWCAPGVCRGTPGWGCYLDTRIRPGRGCTHECDCHGTGYSPIPGKLEWVRKVRDDCQKYGVAFWFKQFGGPTHDAAGRILDGETWSQRPSKHPDALGGVRNPR